MKSMEYRKLPHGEEKISILGFGTSSIGMAGEREIEAAMTLALENGINYFDMASADAAPFPAFGRAMAGSRKDVFFQIHFGANYQGGKYGWTTNLDTIKKSIDWQLSALKTDYIDFGFLHCIDEETDLQKVLHGGILEYIQELKKQGIVRHIGLSSHTPLIVHKMLDTGLLDMLMFSINPAYDFAGGAEPDYETGSYAVGSATERLSLYHRCEANGVAISVMKPFSGGQLLDAKTSPFGKPLTEYQCIQYALDKPGVVTVLPGVRNCEDLKRILGFLNAAPEEKDYAVLGTFTPQEAEGICVYCNHIQPCPAGLDIGLINKYYDLSMAGDELAKNHYANLEKKAGDCIGCGHCDRRCPFHVKQTGRMQSIKEYFGE